MTRKFDYSLIKNKLITITKLLLRAQNHSDANELTNTKKNMGIGLKRSRKKRKRNEEPIESIKKMRAL